MKVHLTRAALKFTAVLGFVGLAACLATAADKKSAMYTPDDIKWQDPVPPFPTGVKIAVLEGNPNQSGPYVFRIKMPDGYKLTPHAHQKPERVTVISGKYHVGQGETFDPKKARALTAGSFAIWQPGVKHFTWAEGETVVQVHGEGPWGLDFPNVGKAGK